jgi:putative molybdopterin biosynthesis protein
VDPQSGEYNWPYLIAELELVPGYRRLQGIVFRRGDSRFEGGGSMMRLPPRWTRPIA